LWGHLRGGGRLGLCFLFIFASTPTLAVVLAIATVLAAISTAIAARFRGLALVVARAAQAKRTNCKRERDTRDQFKELLQDKFLPYVPGIRAAARSDWFEHETRFASGFIVTGKSFAKKTRGPAIAGPRAIGTESHPQREGAAQQSALFFFAWEQD